MYDLSVISNFGLDVKFETEDPCELYVDIIPDTPKKCIRILLVMEPDIISNLVNSVINNKDKFDLILTFDEKILDTCSNSKLFLYGTTWIKDFDFSQEKKTCVTTLVGGKNKTYGHKLRHSLLENIGLIKSIPIDIFNSINTPKNGINDFKFIKHKLWKNEMFYSKFHIAIENNISKNYFTEKIIDCFQTKTIPIYFGCSNIDDFFDKRGIFQVYSLDEIINVCNNLNDETYDDLLQFVDNNYEISLNYTNLESRIKNEVTSFIRNRKK